MIFNCNRYFCCGFFFPNGCLNHPCWAKKPYRSCNPWVCIPSCRKAMEEYQNLGGFLAMLLQPGNSWGPLLKGSCSLSLSLNPLGTYLVFGLILGGNMAFGVVGPLRFPCFWSSFKSGKKRRRVLWILWGCFLCFGVNLLLVVLEFLFFSFGAKGDDSPFDNKTNRLPNPEDVWFSFEEEIGVRLKKHSFFGCLSNNSFHKGNIRISGIQTTGPPSHQPKPLAFRVRFVATRFGSKNSWEGYIFVDGRKPPNFPVWGMICFFTVIPENGRA